MFKANIVFDSGKIAGDFKGRFGRAKAALGNAVLKSCEIYVPYDTGNLVRSGGIYDGGGRVVYSAPYAKKMYYHKGNFSKKVHRSATDAWFEHAKAANLSDWIRTAEKCINSRM